jgi:hypothetical protein
VATSTSRGATHWRARHSVRHATPLMAASVTPGHGRVDLFTSADERYIGGGLNCSHRLTPSLSRSQTVGRDDRTRAATRRSDVARDGWAALAVVRSYSPRRWVGRDEVAVHPCFREIPASIPRSIHSASAASVLHPSSATRTNPFIVRPPNCIGLTWDFSRSLSRSSPRTRTRSPSAPTEQHILPFTMKARAPIILLSTTPRRSDRIRRTRLAMRSS